MKRAIAIVISLIFVLSIAGLAYAVEKAAAPAEKKAEEKKAPAKKQVTGDVASVDAKAGTLTVKPAKGADVMVSVTDKTKIMAGKDKKTLADIKAGDKVTVKYEEAEGKNTAKSIEIKTAPVKKEAAPAKKKAPEEAGGYGAPGYK